MTPEWPFADPPNVAVFVDGRILDGSAWIAFVSHDADDGAWQFHGPSGPAHIDQAKIVALKSVCDIDASITQLADLPLGWCAQRPSLASAWQRNPHE